MNGNGNSGKSGEGTLESARHQRILSNITLQHPPPPSNSSPGCWSSSRLAYPMNRAHVRPSHNESSVLSQAISERGMPCRQDARWENPMDMRVCLRFAWRHEVRSDHVCRMLGWLAGWLATADYPRIDAASHMKAATKAIISWSRAEVPERYSYPGINCVGVLLVLSLLGNSQ